MSNVFYIKKATERLIKPLTEPVLCIGFFLFTGCSGSSSNKLGMGMDSLRSAYSTSSELLQQGVESLSGVKEAVVEAVEAVEEEKSTYMGQAAGWLGGNIGFYTGKWLGVPITAATALGVAWYLPLPILVNGAIGIGIVHGIGKSYAELTTSAETCGKHVGEYAGLALVAGAKAIPRTIYNYGINQYNHAAKAAATADWVAYIEKNKHLLYI
ncbi:MAG: hypothetical protein K2X94_01490 [Amoebophilaceae bacterium]|nr:hypothetical protein [Amoebophilaceae bacterium]